MYRLVLLGFTSANPVWLRAMLLGSLVLMTRAEIRAEDKPAPVNEAAQAFERLKSLKGQWVDNSGTFGAKDKVAVVYEVIGNGSAVMERLFQGRSYAISVRMNALRPACLSHIITSCESPSAMNSTSSTS